MDERESSYRFHLTARTLVAAVLLGLLPVGSLADGEVDTTFGVDGSQILDLSQGGTLSNSLGDLIIQPDGKIVIVGGVNFGSFDYDFAIARLHADGTLDQSFGLQGRVVHAFDLEGAGEDRAESVALRDDGSILVAGRAEFDLWYYHALLQLEPDGSHDLDFGSGGQQSFATHGDQSLVSVIDGGVNPVLLSHSEAVLDGVLTHAIFPTHQGTRLLSPPTSLSGSMYDMALDLAPSLPHVRRYYAGLLTGDGQYDLAVASEHYFLGVLDSSFGGDGWARVRAESAGGDWDSFGLTVEPYPGNRVVAGGWASRNGNLDGFLVRLLADGSPDPSFGAAGQQYVAWNQGGGDEDIVHDIEVQSDGFLVLAATTENAAVYPPIIARLDPTGAYDRSFASNGWKNLPNPTGYVLIGEPEIALQPDGNIVVAVLADPIVSGPRHLFVTRLVSTHVVFADGFESGNTSQWSTP